MSENASIDNNSGIISNETYENPTGIEQNLSAFDKTENNITKTENDYAEKLNDLNKNPFGPKTEDEVVVVSAPPYAVAAIKKAPPSPYDNNNQNIADYNKPVPEASDFSSISSLIDNTEKTEDFSAKLNDQDSEKIMENALDASKKIIDNTNNNTFNN